MNLVLFWYSELQMDVDSKGRKGWFVEIPPGDDRFTHIFEVLNLSGHVDQVAKVGLVNGNTGLAEMEWVTYPRNDLLRAKLDNGDVQYPVYCHVTSANHATTPKGSEEEAGEDDIDQKTLLANRGRGREDDEDSFLPYIVEGPTKMVCKRVGPHYGRKEPGFNLDGFIAAKASRSKRDDDNGGQPAPKKQRGNGTDYRGDKRLEYFIRSLKVKFRFIPERLYGDHEMPLTRKTFFLRGLQKLDPNAEPPTPQPIRSPLAIGEEAAASYMVPPAFTLGAMSDVNMQLAAEITNMPSNGVTSPPNSPSKIDPLVNMSSMSPMVGFDHAGSFASQMALAHQAGLVRAGSKVTVQVPMSPLFQQTNIGRPRKEGVNYIYYKGATLPRLGSHVTDQYDESTRYRLFYHNDGVTATILSEDDGPNKLLSSAAASSSGSACESEEGSSASKVRGAQSKAGGVFTGASGSLDPLGNGQPATAFSQILQPPAGGIPKNQTIHNAATGSDRVIIPSTPDLQAKSEVAAQAAKTAIGMRSISLAEGSANGSTTANHGTETTSNGGERLQDADLSALLEIAPGVNKRPVNKKAVKSPPFPVRGRVLAPPAKRKSLTSSPKKDPADKLSRQGSGTSSWGETSSAADGESAADVEMKEANNDSSMLLEKKERTATIEGDATKSMQPPSPKKGKSPKKKKQIPRTSLAGAQAINKAPMWDIHPNVDVILCCPRPKVLERIFTTLATFGVRRIFLIGGAEKVESSYFAGKKLQPDVIEKAMVEGLSQSSYYTRLPVVRILPKLKLHEVLTGLEIENGGPAPKREVAAASRGGPELPPAAPEVGGASNDRLTNKATFCEEGDDPDTTFISDEQIIKQTELGGRHARKLARGYGNLNIVAHPSIESRKLSDIVGDECYASFRGGFLGKRNFPRVTLCIGPEGGWTEGEMETTLKSFERASLGPRVYKTYDATVSLLTLLYEELGI